MVAVGNDVQPHQRFQQNPCMPDPSSAASSIAATPPSRTRIIQSPTLQIALCVAVVAGLTVLRGIFAVTIELRVDEAYYWTWSRESVISYLDHPPLIAWFIRLGTSLFGDTNFGVRFPGLLA